MKRALTCVIQCLQSFHDMLHLRGMLSRAFKQLATQIADRFLKVIHCVLMDKQTLEKFPSFMDRLADNTFDGHWISSQLTSQMLRRE
jgi:hypothetical protein